MSVVSHRALLSRLVVLFYLFVQPKVPRRTANHGLRFNPGDWQLPALAILEALVPQNSYMCLQ